MMAIGPIQLIVFGFEKTDQFRGEVVEELASLRGRGLIRLIDLFVAIKDPSGGIVSVQMDDLSADESREFGSVIGKLMGVSEQTARDAASAATAAAIERTLAAASKSVGMDYQGLQQLLKDLKPGRAFGVLMFEHTWAIPLRDAIRRAGGVPLAQGFLTQESLVMVGEEVRAIADAEQAIEVAEVVQSAAILNMLATLQEAEAIKTAIAADVVRTLAVAEVIEEAAVGEAINTLAAAGLLEEAYLEEALKTEAKETTEDEAYFEAEKST
jgi:uncharacterized membrane protein